MQSRERLATILLVVGLAALAVLQLRVLDEPFGQSSEGVNGAVWGLGSRALRDDGPIASRLGARSRLRDGDGAYATHPPGLVVVTAASELVLGERPWATRLPSLLGTLAAFALLHRLLLRLGVGPWPAVAATLALAFSAWIVAFASMVDTWVLGLAPGVAVLIVDLRRRQGQPVRPPAAAAIVASACLTSWLGCLFAGMVAGAAGVAIVRRRAGAAEASVVAGFAAGIALSGAWVAWAYGSGGPLLDQLRTRSGAGERDATPLDGLAASAERAVALVPLPVLLGGLVGLALACASARSRATTAVATTGVVLWSAVLPDGAVIHPYWSTWAVVPLTLGLGHALAALGSMRRLIVATAVGGLGVSVAAGAASGIAYLGQVREAAGGARLVDEASWPVDQRVVPVVGSRRGQPEAWVAYASGRVARRESAAGRPPGHLAVVLVERGGGGPGCVPGRFVAGVAVVRANEVVADDAALVACGDIGKIASP